MSQPVTTYGTEVINIDGSDTKSDNGNVKRCCAVYKACSALSVLVLLALACAYLNRNHQIGVDTVAREITKRRDSGPTTSFSVDSLSMQNCANDGDESCDEQNGCISYEDDIAEVMVAIVNSWHDFMEYIMETSDVFVDGQGCLQSAFISSELSCIDKCDDVLGYEAASSLNLCKNTFLDNMKSTLAPYRKSCIAALLSQQIATRCARKYSSAESMEKAAFLWWKDRLSVSDSWTHQQCPYYI